MSEWVVFPNLAGTGGVIVQADQMTVTDGGALVFSSNVSGTLKSYKVFAPTVYAYVVAA